MESVMFRTFGAWLLGASLALAGALPLQAAPVKAADVLDWTQAQRQDRFWRMETLLPHQPVPRGNDVRALPRGKPLTVTVSDHSIDAFMAADRTVGLLVLQDGKVRLARYAGPLTPTRHWAGFSLTKSLTSTLYAVALRDHSIRSLDDSVATYLPEMKGSAYEGVTIRQLLTMSSGVRWNEDYSDPKSDVARMYGTPADPGLDPITSYMRKLPREAPAGTKWNYKTGETDLAGVLLIRATGKPLAQYASEKLWKPLGMAQDGVWMINEAGVSPGGCCLSATLDDWGRFGQFILDGGRVGGRQLLPGDWLPQATRTQIDIGRPGLGYGYFWWTNADGTFDAKGIFGQMIHIDPKRHLVVVALGAWDAAYDKTHAEGRDRLVRAVAAAVDAEKP
jgi:CubicO group peptidase (beta-lactamase class C family)